jgi:predicted transcriptional regulator
MAVVGKKLLNGRRSDVQIMVEILDVALHGAGKTEIVYKANLNFQQARKYLNFLTDKGLMVASGSVQRTVRYQTTENGKMFTRHYKETVASIR